MTTQKETNEFIENFLSLLDFVTENKKSGRLTKSQSDEIEKLWNNYKLPRVEAGTSVISADFGILGSLVIRKVKSSESRDKLEYKSGSYDYVSIVSSSMKRILWTDYSDTEPYNRQGGLYCDGSSFESLGQPVLETREYHEFIAVDNYESNISFAIWGYRYNDFYGSITFGICIKTELVDEFISALRKIINK